MEESKRESVHFDDDIFLRGDTYYYRGTPPGSKKQIERSLSLKKGTAQKDILKAKRDLVDSMGNIGTRSGKNAFEILAKRYVEERWREAKNPEVLSERTANETDSIMELHAIPYFRNKRVDEIEQADFKDYCSLKSKQKLNLVNHRKVMNHFMKWCVHESILKYRIVFEIPKQAQRSRRSRVVLTSDEVVRLVKAIISIPKDAPDIRIERSMRKTRLYVLMYLFMGMRNMEICKLRWDEIDLDRKALRINKWNNRRRKERAIPINSYVFAVLNEEKPLSESEWVFPTATKDSKKPYMDPSGAYRKGWAKALQKAELGAEFDRHITPHDLRATFETFMHTNKEITDTQREKMAGASIDVQKNTYVTMDVDHLREAAESVQIPEIHKLFRENTRAKVPTKDASKSLNNGKYKGKKKR